MSDALGFVFTPGELVAASEPVDVPSDTAAAAAAMKTTHQILVRSVFLNPPPSLARRGGTRKIICGNPSSGRIGMGGRTLFLRCDTRSSLLAGRSNNPRRAPSLDFVLVLILALVLELARRAALDDPDDQSLLAPRLLTAC